MGFIAKSATKPRSEHCINEKEIPSD